MKEGAALCVLLFSAGCTSVGPRDGIVCTALFAYGLNVHPQDSVSGALNASGTNLVVTDGSFKDSVAIPASHPELDNSSLNSAGERAGTYQLTVRKAGYKTWVKSGVQVTRDECHVIPVSVTALLQLAS